MNTQIFNFCIKHDANYSVYRTLTGNRDFSSMVSYTLKKHEDRILDNILCFNAVLAKFKERLI